MIYTHEPAGATDAEIRGPLWCWHPYLIPLVKHERRKRFSFDIDDIDAPTGVDE